ncbi:nucleotidyltransferase domain-containing protein [Calidithermus chliarophilus]|uniref:nucleotidyltransferase domain-containing protein n=1 Tax=Calidithermus chliarophilus TaxID=52023 RepID=UPI000684F9A7|nr:nucleotidyltransferase domain-containing protein [Calidithermus chliarophilus]
MDHPLPQPLIAEVLEEFVPPEAVGVGLLGSFARGQGQRYSDLDLNIFVPRAPEERAERYTLRRRSGRLISLKKLTLEAQRAELSRPQDAVWAVPGLRQMRVLYDPHGGLARLKAEAEAFAWEGLEHEADAFVSYEVLTGAEEVHKVLGGLERQDPSKVVYATLGLGLGAARLMAVHKRLFIESENRYFDLLYRALGRESPWSRAHKLAVGWKAGAFERRGIAALQLYWETFMEVQAVVREEHLEVVHPTLQAIQEGGWLEARL